MLDDSSREYANNIREGYEGYTISEKFNNHNLDVRMIKSESAVEDKTPFINIFIKNNEVAKNLVAKWFNRSPKGGFNMDTIASRGSYNASELDAKVARSTKRGMAILQDAGVELIQNTFLVVTDFRYTTMEAYLEKYENIGKDLTKTFGSSGLIGSGAKLLTNTSQSLSKVTTGYVVYATTYLYQLEWNDSIEAVMYEQYWTEDGSIDPDKVRAFNESKIFSLNFIGKEVKEEPVPELKAANKSQEELIRVSTRRALDAAIAKLQKKYEEFKIKTPLFTTDPITAQIGLKEGIEGGDDFSVLEQRQDDDGRTFYKKIGTISVDNKQIWDNRFPVGGEEQQGITATLFKGAQKDKYYSGLLIRQGKNYSEKKKKPIPQTKNEKTTNK
jgi:hypothetical protein